MAKTLEEVLQTTKSPGERVLAAQLLTSGLLSVSRICVGQFEFAVPRKWAFDFAFPFEKLAIEIQGGSGAHHHGSIIERGKDYEKHFEAVQRNWRVLYGITAQAEDGTLLEWVKKCL